VRFPVHHQIPVEEPEVMEVRNETRPPSRARTGRRLGDSGNVRDPSSLPDEDRGARTDTWAAEQLSRVNSAVVGENTGLRTPEARRRTIDRNEGVGVTPGLGVTRAASIRGDPAPSRADSRRVDDQGSRLVTHQSPRPARKLASKAWPVFDDTKHRWEEFRARTVNAARRSGHNDGEIALALHEALPGDAVIYLDERGVSNMDLDDMLWHLELLFRSRTKNPELAQTALEKVIRGEIEPAMSSIPLRKKSIDVSFSSKHTRGEPGSQGTEGVRGRD
jgi:hypothetical protein